VLPSAVTLLIGKGDLMRRNRIRQIAVAAVMIFAASWPSQRAEAQQGGISFQFFVENYGAMQPTQVLDLLASLNQNQLMLLTSYGALSQDILRTACQANANIWLSIQGTQETCQSAWYQLQEALQWISGEQLQQNIQNERDQMLIGLKCASGEFDQASCNAYMATQGAVMTMQNDTSLRIIENMGNQCRVGVDAGCVPY